MLDLWLLSCLYERPQLHTLIAWIMVKIITLIGLILRIGMYQFIATLLSVVSHLISVLWLLTILTIGVYRALHHKKREKIRNKLHIIASKNLGKLRK